MYNSVLLLGVMIRFSLMASTQIHTYQSSVTVCYNTQHASLCHSCVRAESQMLMSTVPRAQVSHTNLSIGLDTTVLFVSTVIWLSCGPLVFEGSQPGRWTFMSRVSENSIRRHGSCFSE